MAPQQQHPEPAREAVPSAPAAADGTAAGDGAGEREPTAAGAASHAAGDEAAGKISGKRPGKASGVVPLHLDLSAQLARRRAATYRTELAATTNPGRRAAVFAALAIAESMTDPEQAAASLAGSLRAADEAGTPTARAYAAMARYGIDLAPESLATRTVAAREALDLLADPDCAEVRSTLLPTAYFMQLGALMESASIRDLDATLSPELHSNDLLTPMLGSRYAAWFRCARACLDGALPLAERLAAEGHQLALDAGDVDAEAVWVGQIAIVRWMQGRISEMESVFLRVRQADPDEPVWAASVAWIWTHQGRMAAARGVIESLPKIADWPRGRNFLAGAAILAEVAAEIGSTELVSSLYQELLPFADRIVPIGLGVVCWGTVARPLALLARRQDNLAEAFQRYHHAIELCSRVGAQAWLAQAQIELAALHLEQGEAATAQQLAGEALTAARHLGLRGVEQRADRLLGTATGPGAADRVNHQLTLPAHVSLNDTAVGPEGTPAPGADTAPGTDRDGAGAAGASTSMASSRRAARKDGGPDRAPSIPRITVLGVFAVTTSTGEPATWKSRKARTLLKMLLARRGATLARESAMELLWPGENPDILKNRFAVAMTTLRKTLDPARLHPADEFLVANADTVRLRIDRLSVDVEDFLQLAQTARAASTATLPAGERQRLLRRAIAAYRGTAFADELYEAWAEQLRRQTHLAFFALAHALADLVGADGDHFEQAELYRQILAADPYDQAAHDGLIGALTALGASSHLETARRERHRMMAELGLPSS